jgi:hypothetical protein
MAKSKSVSKSKSNTKSNAKSKSKSNVLPDGYKVIQRAPNWDAVKNPVIEGVRGEVFSVKLNKGKKDERSVNVMTVTDRTLGDVTVWESGMLSDMFERTKAGQTVRIEYLGEGKPAKAGQNPPKLFSAAVKE